MKNYNREETAVYKKVNNQYEKIGYDWEGFPANGVWIVEDGSQNCIRKLQDLGTMPKLLPGIMELQDECNKYIESK